MRTCLFLVLAFLSPFVSAADFTVHVTDPQGASVSGATVLLYSNANAALIASATTNAAGAAKFPSLEASDCKVQVLATGFAELLSSGRGDSGEVYEAHLRIAARTESVVVTATATPMPGDQTGAPVETLDREALLNRQPADAADAIRYMPGIVVSTAGRRGDLATLFVRGGDSRYNKVLIDGVPVDEPGGQFDFGVVSPAGMDRMEFVRGPESVLYGSDALTSVLQMFSAQGTTETPQVTFGADGGTFSTAHGYANASGAFRRLDYNVFGEQFNTEGQGFNDAFSNSTEGGNVGVRLAPKTMFRFRTRHGTARTGVQSFWDFNGLKLLPPDSDERSHQNNFLASAELTIDAPRQWKHSLSGYEYHHVRTDVDTVMDAGRANAFGNFDFPFSTYADFNRAGFAYHGEWDPRLWARTNFGYEYENENGYIGDLTFPPLTHGLRRNQAVYGQQSFIFPRLTIVAGGRFVHNESFGNTGVPRASASFVALRGGEMLGATRLRVAYGQGIKEPSFDESFGIGSFFIIPNPHLKPEQSRTIEAGLVQSFENDRYAISAGYYHNIFRNQIAFTSDPATFIGQYLNLNRSLAHGAELEFHARPLAQLSVEASYTYTSTQILESPVATNPLLESGAPLLRRPKHAASATINYAGRHWGANLSAVAIGRRPDSDFLGLQPAINHAAGYARVDTGGWCEVHRNVTAYLTVENLLNRRYQEVVGYPGLGINARIGLRFTLGGAR
jgi:vitamin B12 transporter